MDTASSARVVALVADLMFASKIRGAGTALGVETRTCMKLDELRSLVSETTPRLVLVDLGAPGALQAVEALSGEVTVVAFGPHVETEALRAAVRAGAERVVTRSALVRELPALLRGVSDGGVNPH